MCVDAVQMMKQEAYSKIKRYTYIYKYSIV